MIVMKKTIEDHKKTEIEDKAIILQHEKQLQKLQLTFQHTANELREATLQIQAVRFY